MNLYDIDATIRQLIETQVDEEGVLLPEAFAQIEALCQDRTERIDFLLSRYKELLAEQEALKAEYSKLQKRAKTKEQNADRIKRYLATVFQHEGGVLEKFENSRHKTSWRRSESLVVDSTRDIPARFLIPQVPKVDTLGLKLYMKEGKKVPGVHIEEKQNLQIK